MFTERIPELKAGLPGDLAGIIGSAAWTSEDFGDASEAVIRLDRPDGWRAFLKVRLRERRNCATLDDERARCVWLAGRLPVPVVLGYAADDRREWLLTTAVPGKVACDPALGLPREAVVRELARGLRRIHALPRETCPFDGGIGARVALARQMVAAGDLGQEDLDRALAIRPVAEDLVVTHGDYCEPNILLDDRGVLAGFIDLGYVGVADRWQDLALAIFSLRRNGDGSLVDMFLEEYGAAMDSIKLEFFQRLEGLFP